MLTSLVAINGLILGRDEQADRNRNFAAAGGIAVALLAAFTLAKAFWIANAGPFPGVGDPVETAVDQVNKLGWIAPGVVGMCLVGVLCGSVIGRRVRWWFVAGAGLAMTAIWLFGSGIETLRAGVANQWAGSLYQTGRLPQAFAVFGFAQTLEPRNVPTRLIKANVAMDLTEANEENFSTNMAGISAELEEGMQRTPLSRSNHQLGQVFLRWGLGEDDAATRREVGSRAAEAFERARRFEPGSETVWFEASLVDRYLLDDETAANVKLAKANALTQRVQPPLPNIYATEWGDFYWGLALRADSRTLREAYGRRALGYFERGIAEDREAAAQGSLSRTRLEQLPADHYQTRIAIGMIYRDLGSPREALGSFREAAKTELPGGSWEAEGRVAEMLMVLGERVEAMDFVERALATAPPKVRTDLEALKTELTKQP